MAYLGQTHTGTYMTAPHMMGSSTPAFLPTLNSMPSAHMSYMPYDTYPAPTPLVRSLTTLPWNPSTYWGTGRVAPTIPNSRSMPEPNAMANRLTQLDSVKVPPTFASARNARYTRYTPDDWRASNLSNYMASDRVRGGSERVRYDAARLCREIDDMTSRTQTDVGKKLGDRIGDINFWKTEINNETDRVIGESEALTRAKGVLEKTLAETENPLHVAQECLYFREKRQGVDLVHDEVEKKLIEEVDIIKRCQEEMRRLVQDSNNQLSLNRAAQHELEKDSADKFSAMNLDSQCHGMRNTSRGLAYHDGVERVDNTTSVPESWAKFSNNNIQRSQSERSASTDKRNQIEQLLNKCLTVMVNQWNNVKNALTDRIREYVDAKNKLQTNLSQVLQEISDMEKNIEMLKMTIQAKEAPLQLSQTRLNTRTRRPNVEGCRDPVQHRLVEEVGEIFESIDHLKAKLRESENGLQQLLRMKTSLEHDLAIKSNSLHIDREKCLSLHSQFPMSPRVSSF